jgi:RimJ/RimL family protein N-acetyltransferase
MSIENSLFDGKLVRLSALDYDADPPVESKWTHDPEFMRMVNPTNIVRPLSPAQVKKKYEKLEKDAAEGHTLFRFNVRTLPDEAALNGRLVGLAELYGAEWNHGTGNVRFGIGSPDDRRKGYGRETLRLLLRYAFDELNLYRLSAVTVEYNLAALALLKSEGFVDEVRRRGAVERDLRRWDMLHLGLLRDEWRRA